MMNLSVYTNSLLATLNARQIFFRGAGNDGQSGDSMSVTLRDIPKGTEVNHIIFPVSFHALTNNSATKYSN